MDTRRHVPFTAVLEHVTSGDVYLTSPSIRAMDLVLSNSIVG